MRTQHVQVLSATQPFDAWPLPARRRLARRASVAAHARGDLIHAGGSELTAATVVADGVVQASAAAGGRRVIFEIARGPSLHGLLPLLDGRALLNDLVALEPTTTLSIPFEAIREELALSPALWQGLCQTAAGSARRSAEQLRQFLFDAPRVRMAAVLLELAQGEGPATNGPPVVGVRLPQDRLAEMLGVSRQWAALLVREMSAAGLVDWHYGRATLLDPAGLRGIARGGINAAVQCRPRPDAPSSANGPDVIESNA